MKYMITTVTLLLALAASALAQITVEQLSYFPLHVGNIWVYKVSHDYGLGQGPEFQGYVTDTVSGTSMYPNGLRYYMKGPIAMRIDTLTGRVYRYVGGPRFGSCTDSSEIEVFNLTVDSTWLYIPCHGTVDRATVTPSAGPIKVALLDVARNQRIWTQFTQEKVYASGIGLCESRIDANGTLIYELTYAYINGTEYWPVDFRSFAAAVLPGNQVHLRWRTENEVQNAGFTVQRRSTGGASAWDDLTFIPANASEGEGTDYEYTDNTASDLQTGARLAYRLRQLDYDGTESYSDIVEVALSDIPETVTLTAWPNPANTSLSMYASSISEGASQLLVTDLLGRELRRFESVHNGVLTWDLTTSIGARVPPGMYRLLLVSQGTSIGRTVVVR